MQRLVHVWLVLVFVSAGCDSKSQRGGGNAGEEVDPWASAPKTCRSDEPAASQPQGGALLRIAVIPKGTTHEFWKAIHAGAVKAQDELAGVQITWKGPIKESDRNEQISVVENFINSGVDGIVLAPLDDVSLARPVKEARATGIGVVIMDSDLKAEVCTTFASYVATDNYQGGRKGGEKLGELLGGKGRVLMMPYQVGSASTMKRERGFLDAIDEKYPQIEVLSSDQYAGATTEEAVDKAENLLNRFPEVDGIFCPNESTTFGMLLALQEAGRAGKVKFVGFDSSEKLIRALEAGELHGLVLQDPLNMGYTAVKTIVAYLRGEEVETRVDTGSRVATPENMHDPLIRTLLAPPIDEYLK